MKDSESNNSSNSPSTPSGGPYSAKEVEGKWTKFWFENKLFDLKIKAGSPAFSAALPPPNITGNLHMGHALNGTLQDVLFRYKRMQGFNVLWQPGTDHAGISTQMVVERELKKQGKSRHDLGRDAFIKKVWEWRNQYGSAILNQYKRLGVSFAWDRVAFTMDESYVEAIYKVFVQLFKEGLIYRGRRVVNWCPSCLTSLSDLEVLHEDKSGFLYVIKYPLADGSADLSIATTRPETMFADVAVAVNPQDSRYAKYIGKKVILPLSNREIPVIADSYVDKEFGTGALKITPAHDLNDFEVGQRHKLEMPIVIDEAGKLVIDKLVPIAYQGMERFAARQKVVEDLDEKGFLIESKKHDNAVGICDRCSTVIEPRLSDQWYLSMKELAKPAIEAVESKKIRFIPERYTSTYIDWMNNIRDWCISRQLWWGHRIPVWTCTKCNTVSAFEKPPTTCPKCNHNELEQDPDVLDTWFSSGLFPFATLGWPKSTPEMATFYPTSVLVTARDIINLWVSRMIFFSLKCTNKIPFKDILIHPVIQTPDGKRMSKSKGNAVDPIDMIDKYGADATRLWFTSVGIKGDQDVRFREDKLEEYKKFVNKLWNAGKFVISKINTGLEQNKISVKNLTQIDTKHLSLPDHWILSRYSKLLTRIQIAYDSYDYQVIANELYQFTWDYFCDWYIEISKIPPDEFRQIFGEEPQTEKILYLIFEGLLRAFHPIMPFVTEELSNQLQKIAVVSKPLPIINESYPVANVNLIKDDAEQQMDLLIDFIRYLRDFRQTYDIPKTVSMKVRFESDSTEERNLVIGNIHFIEKLSGVELSMQSNSGQHEEHFAKKKIGNIIVRIPLTQTLTGVADSGKAKEKLSQRHQSALKELQKLMQVSDSNDFKTKAPPEKVQELQKQLGSVKDKVAYLEAQLKVLN